MNTEKPPLYLGELFELTNPSERENCPIIEQFSCIQLNKA